jgi:hypothetical protein
VESTSGRLVFKIGDAFPVDSPVAVFLVAISTALNDLLTVSKWLTGGDYDQPHQFDVSDVEQLYLLRLTFAQVHEVRESVKHARRDAAVAAFLDTLPEPAKRDLDGLMNMNTRDAPWALEAMEYVRNQTNHYGGKWNWDDLTWAMKQAAETDGEIEMRNAKLVGMRLKFADSVANQHLSRKWPEYMEAPDAELDDATIAARLSALFIAMREVVTVAQNFAVAALNAYIATLPEGVIRIESVTYAES